MERWYIKSEKFYGNSWNGECCPEKHSRFSVSAKKPDGSSVEIGTCNTDNLNGHGINIVIKDGAPFEMNCFADIY